MDCATTAVIGWRSVIGTFLSIDQTALRRECTRAAGLDRASHHEREWRQRFVLEKRPVHLRHRRDAQTFLPNIADDADDRDPDAFAFKAGADAFPDWIFAWPIFSRESLVDQSDSLAVLVVGFGERAALEQRNAHRPKIISRNEAPVDAFRRGSRRQWAIFDSQRGIPVTVAHRQEMDAASGLHAWQMGDPLENLTVISPRAFRRVLEISRRKLEGDYLVGFESGIDVLQSPEALDEESSADDERQGQRYLGDYEERTQAAARRCRDAAAFLQRGLEIGIGILQRGASPKRTPARAEIPREKESTLGLMEISALRGVSVGIRVRENRARYTRGRFPPRHRESRAADFQ